MSLKPAPTASEKAELETTKSEVKTAYNKNQELSVKQNLTQEDRALIEEYSKRANLMADTANRWLREFTTDLQAWADKQKADSLT